MHYRAIAAYYDAEYEHNEMLQQDVPFMLDHLPKRRQRVLEIATGTGRAAIPLAQAGHRVVGTDIAADVLAIAKRKRDSVGLTDKELLLVKQDARKLDVGGGFDFACILFNTFVVFTSTADQDRVLDGVRRHLRKRGRLWIDIFNPDLTLLAQTDQTHLDPISFYVPALDRSVHRDTELHVDPASELQELTFHYRWFDRDGTAHHEQRVFNLTFMFHRELTMVLERNGFAVERLYGDYDGSEITTESPRIIAMAKRVK